MSLNPHLGEDLSSSSWETISSSGSSEGGISSVFFGGATHTFTVFRPSSPSVNSEGSRSSFSSFGKQQKSTSLPEMAQDVDHSFEEREEDASGVSTYDPSILVGKAVSLDSGIDKSGKGSLSKTAKIRKTVRGFFKSTPKAPSMKSFMESGAVDFPDPYSDQTSVDTKKTTSSEKKPQKQPAPSTSGSKRTLGAKPKVIQKKPTPTPKKTSSFNGLKSLFKGSVKSQPKSKQPLTSPRSGITKKDISGPMSRVGSGAVPKRPAPQPPASQTSPTQRPIPKRPAPQPPVGSKKSSSPQHPTVPPPPIPTKTSSVRASSSSSISSRSLEDQLKAIWEKVEGTNPKTYSWLGNTLLTQGMNTMADMILRPGDKKVSIPRGFGELLEQCMSLINGNKDDMRAVICALLDSSVDLESSFSDLLDTNEGSQPLVDLFVKLEDTFSGPRQRLFLSSIAIGIGETTKSTAKSLTTSGGGIDVKLGASATQSSSQVLKTLLQSGYQESWSNVLQVITNDTFS